MQHKLFDNDVWIWKDESNDIYEYIITHVDDFMIVYRKSEKETKKIQPVYLVKDSSKGEPYYYLGNNYNKDKSDWWKIIHKKYLTESISHIESMFGDLPKNNIPMQDGYHPMEYTSSPMSDKEHKIYQTLNMILHWVVCLRIIDL